MSLSPMPFAATLALALTTAALPAQPSRVFLGPTPTNMHADWSQIATAPDPSLPNTFVAVMPLSQISSWAFWESDMSMTFAYGPGNWQQLTLTAVDWAYVTATPCAHQPAPGASAPLSLLTTDYDFGPYSGQPGTPLFTDASYFVGGPQSFVSGLGNTFSFERWQLRTRGFFTTDLWNACPPPVGVTPSFSGFLGVRFSF